MQVLIIFPMPSISLTRTSPAFKNSGGFLLMPTPAGVPVRIKSPGYSVTILKFLRKYISTLFVVKTYCERYETKKSILKISSDVFPSCFNFPFTYDLMLRFSGSSASFATTHGPNGQKVSIDLPNRN